MNRLKIAIVSAAVAAAVPANAAVVIDGSPTGPRIGNWSNISSEQNFLVKFTLGSATNLNGFDIFTDKFFSNVGQAVRVRIRADSAGSPEASNLFSFNSMINASTLFSGSDYIIGTDFGAINLAAGTYWFGVSGLGEEIGWSSFNNGGSEINANQRRVIDETVLFETSMYDLAFRVRSDSGVGAVPEPATWLMLLFGFGAIGASMRYRRGTMTVKFA